MSRSAFYSRNASYSRSYNAEVAESEGRFPMTRAIPVVAKEAGVTRKIARAALIHTYDGEWHHVGRYANEVAYYDCGAAVDALADPEEREEIELSLTSAGQEELRLREYKRDPWWPKMEAFIGCTIYQWQVRYQFAVRPELHATHGEWADDSLTIWTTGANEEEARAKAIQSTGGETCRNHNAELLATGTATADQAWQLSVNGHCR